VVLIVVIFVDANLLEYSSSVLLDGLDLLRDILKDDIDILIEVLIKQWSSFALLLNMLFKSHRVDIVLDETLDLDILFFSELIVINAEMSSKKTSFVIKAVDCH